MGNVPVKGQNDFNVVVGQQISAVMYYRNLTDEKLATMIVDQNLTGEQLKKEIEKTRVNITRYRNGQRQCPTVVLKKMAEACDVSVDFLLGLSPTKKSAVNYPTVVKRGQKKKHNKIYSPEEIAINLGIFQSISDGECEKCEMLFACSNAGGFTPPPECACMKRRDRMLKNWGIDK